jgi:hypothetical protein
MSAPFGNVKYSEFVPGDSGILGTSLLKAANQLFTKFGNAVVAYNAANGALPLPLADTNNDPESSLRTNTFTLLARKVYNPATAKFDTVFATYIEPYSNWVTPTTGNLAGCTTLSEACYLVSMAIKQAYDLLQPNAFVADPSGLASITDATDGQIPIAIQYLMVESIDPATGDTVFAVNDLLELLDRQEGV